MGSSRRSCPRPGIAAACLFAVVLLVVTVTGREFGLHWDATLFLRESIRFAGWFRSWTDPEIEAPPFSEIEYYFGRVQAQPPAYRVSTGLAVALFSDWMGVVYAARLVSAGAYALTVAGIFFLLRGYGWRTGLVGALVFATFPRIFGFAHLHSVDMLMTCVYFYVVASLPWLLRRRLGIVWGTFLHLAAFLTKIQGFLIPIVHLCWIVLERVLSRREKQLPFRASRAICLVIVSTVLASILFLVAWPYMLFDGGRGLREYIAYVFSHGQLNVLYFGKVYAGADFPPWHYVLVMPAITIPVISLALILTGTAQLLRRGTALPPRRADQPLRNPTGVQLESRERLWFLGAFVHLAVMALPKAPKHDGTRLLFMAYPFLAVMAAIGFHGISWRVEQVASQYGKRAAKHCTTVLAAGVIILLILELVAMFPYQGIYYNQLVGGPGGAVKRGFDGDYLGVYAQHGYPFINQYCEPESVLFFSAANTANHYGPAARSLAEKSPDLVLRPDLRVFGIRQRNYLIACRADRLAVLGGRLAAYGSVEKDLIDSRKPVYTLERFSVPLLRLYSLPNPEDSLLAIEPLLNFPEVSLLSLESEDQGKTWEAIWVCRSQVRHPLAVAFCRRGTPHEPEHWETFHHLVASISTIYWRPGDVFRSEYVLQEPIPTEEIQLAVFPHHSRPEEIHFLAPR